VNTVHRRLSPKHHKRLSVGNRPAGTPRPPRSCAVPNEPPMASLVAEHLELWKPQWFAG